MAMKTRLGLATIMVMTGSHAFAQATAAPLAQSDAAQADAENNPPIPGANSFTEDQARDRIEKAGYAEVKDLKKDDQGVWRAGAKKDGGAVDVALDFQGNVVSAQR